MWQYTSSGRVAGISGDVDLNLRFFRDGSKDDLTEVWKDPDGREDPQEEIQEAPQEEQEDSGKDSQEGQQPSQDIPSKGERSANKMRSPAADRILHKNGLFSCEIWKKE